MIEPRHGIETANDASDVDNGPESNGVSFDVRSMKFAPPHEVVEPQLNVSKLP